MAPKAAAAMTMSPRRTRSRLAASSDPTIAPTAMIDESTPNSVAPRPNSTVDIVEMKMGKLKPNVPTRNTMTSTTRMSLRPKT